MKIFLATSGSRGDVQPMLALSLGLKERGYEVLLAGPPERARWAADLGCPYVPLGGDVMAFIAPGPSTQTLRGVSAFCRYVRREIRLQFQRLPELIAGADLVVGASLCFALSSVAEAMGISYRYIAFTPQLLPSGHHPCPIFKNQCRPPWLNRMGWWWALAVDRFITVPLINRHRRRLALPPVSWAGRSYLGERVVVASDRALGGIPPDVTIAAVQTGYMHLNQKADRIPALERFLENGSAPVYVGFGSMPRVDQSALMPVAVEASKMSGCRMVMAASLGMSRNNISGSDLFVIPSYPHEALFPRVSAVVHHGGAGTTATAAASGVPQIVVPHILDQYYWGEKVGRAGIGPRGEHRSRLTASKLAGFIDACRYNAEMKQRARTVGNEIRRQDGVGKTVKELF